MTVQDIRDLLNTLAPEDTAFEWDNVGLMVGDPNAEVRSILTALDCTDEVIAEAKIRGANLIVTHHPLIFHAPYSIVTGDPDGDRIMELIKSGIAVISMHTNLDRAAHGVNDVLADILGLRNIALLPGGDNVCRMGNLPASMETDAFLNHVKTALNVDALRVSRTECRVEKVAVGGGACGEYLRAAHDAGCDAFVTADVKHHEYIEAAHLGLLLVDATHYATENVVIRPLADYLRRRCPNVAVAQWENPVRLY